MVVPSAQRTGQRSIVTQIRSFIQVFDYIIRNLQLDCRFFGSIQCCTKAADEPNPKILVLYHMSTVKVRKERERERHREREREREREGRQPLHSRRTHH